MKHQPIKLRNSSIIDEQQCLLISMMRVSGTVSKVITGISLLLWIGFFCKLATKITNGYSEYLGSDKSEDVKLFRYIYTFQSINIMLSIIRMQSLSPIIRNIRWGLKLFIIWYYLENETDGFAFMLMAASWTFWEIFLKANSYVRQLTEVYLNLFIIMEPAIVYSTCLVVLNYRNRHEQNLSTLGSVMLWIVLIGYVGSCIETYGRQWSSRMNYYDIGNKPQKYS